MDLAEEAVIANGIVLAYAGGEDATQVVPDRPLNDPRTGLRRRPELGSGAHSEPRRAVLYALDGLTGKESRPRTQIESWNHFSASPSPTAAPPRHVRRDARLRVAK
jgi:hypothetical protein